MCCDWALSSAFGLLSRTALAVSGNTLQSRIESTIIKRTRTHHFYNVDRLSNYTSFMVPHDLIGWFSNSQ